MGWLDDLWGLLVGWDGEAIDGSGKRSRWGSIGDVVSLSQFRARLFGCDEDPLWTPLSSFLFFTTTSLFFVASLFFFIAYFFFFAEASLFFTIEALFFFINGGHSYSSSTLPPSSFSIDSCFLESSLNTFLAPHLSFWPLEQKDEDFFRKIVKLV